MQAQAKPNIIMERKGENSVPFLAKETLMPACKWGVSFLYEYRSWQTDHATRENHTSKDMWTAKI